MSVIDVVMISSPGSGSMAATAACTAAEPDAQATACWTPSSSAKRFSNRATSVPLVLVSVPDRDHLGESAELDRRRSCGRWRPGRWEASWTAGQATVTNSPLVPRSASIFGAMGRPPRIAAIPLHASALERGQPILRQASVPLL